MLDQGPGDKTEPVDDQERPDVYRRFPELARAYEEVSERLLHAYSFPPLLPPKVTATLLQAGAGWEVPVEYGDHRVYRFPLTTHVRMPTDSTVLQHFATCPWF